MKNSVADRSNAQSSCAAQFIGNNIEVYTILLLLLLAYYFYLYTATTCILLLLVYYYYYYYYLHTACIYYSKGQNYDPFLTILYRSFWRIMGSGCTSTALDLLGKVCTIYVLYVLYYYMLYTPYYMLSYTILHITVYYCVY